MATDLMAQYLLGQAGQRGQRQSPQSAMAARLLAEGASTAPVYSPMAGLARALTGAIGGYQGRLAEQSDNDRRERDFERINEYQTQQRAASAAEVQDFMRQFGMGGGGAPAAAPAMPSAPPAGPVSAAPLAAHPGVAQRGEAPPAVTQGISARAALDPNSPTYAQDIMRINDGVVAQTMPGGRVPQQAVPTAAPPPSAGQGGPDWRAVAAAGAVSNNPAVQRLAGVAAQFANREAQMPPTVQMNGPQGPGTYERLPGGGLRFLGGVPEAALLPADVEAQRARLAQAGRPSVEVRTGAGFAEQLATGAARQIGELQGSARTAAEGLRASDRIADLLDSGVITGTLAESRLGLERALRTAGLIDGARVANTEQLMSELARGTLEAAGGLSGPTSDRDIMFLREVAGGSVTLDAESIRRIVTVAREKNERTVGRYNDMAGIVSRDETLPPAMRELYRPIDFPTRERRPQAPAAPTIRNPQTGERLRLDGGQWVPMP